MPWPFSGDKKPSQTPPKKRRQETAEQKKERLDLKRKQFLHEGYLEMAQGDPDIKREMIAKEFNLNIKTIDPTEKKKREIEAKIVDKALEKITSDPELTEKFVDVQVEKIIGGANEEPEDGEGGSLIRQLIDEKQDWQELEELMGGGGEKSFLKTLVGLLTPESIQAIGNLLKQGSAPRTYVVEIAGELKELNEGAYFRFLEQRKGLPAAPPTTETPITAPEEVSEFEGEQSTDPVERFLGGIDLGTLVDEALNEDPTVYAQIIYGQVLEGHDRAKLLWELLSKTSYETIVGFLQQNSSNAKYGVHIQKILMSEENLIWLQSLVTAVKEMQVE